jgi:hypothetical protein
VPGTLGSPAARRGTPPSRSRATLTGRVYSGDQARRRDPSARVRDAGVATHAEYKSPAATAVPSLLIPSCPTPDPSRTRTKAKTNAVGTTTTIVSAFLPSLRVASVYLFLSIPMCPRSGGQTRYRAPCPCRRFCWRASRAQHSPSRLARLARLCTVSPSPLVHPSLRGVRPFGSTFPQRSTACMRACVSPFRAPLLFEWCHHPDQLGNLCGRTGRLVDLGFIETIIIRFPHVPQPITGTSLLIGPSARAVTAAGEAEPCGYGVAADIVAAPGA